MKAPEKSKEWDALQQLICETSYPKEVDDLSEDEVNTPLETLRRTRNFTNCVQKVVRHSQLLKLS